MTEKPADHGTLLPEPSQRVSLQNETGTLTAQDVFNTVRDHLLAQRRRAIRGELSDAGNSCAYRGDDGTKCAVGCLIADDEYSQEMEGRSVQCLIDPDVYDYQPLRRYLPFIDMLGALQWIHDNDAPEMWPERLARLAADYGLDPTTGSQS